MSNNISNNNSIEKNNNLLKSILTCDLCNKNFDLNSHKPLIAKCGHSFCKFCILSNNNDNNNNACPVDNINYVLSIESCIPNLKIEEIIKKIFNKENKINQKQIIYIKPEVKRNRSPSIKRNYINRNNNNNIVIFNRNNFDKNNKFNNNNNNNNNNVRIRSSTSNKYKENFRFTNKTNLNENFFNNIILNFNYSNNNSNNN